MCIYVNKSKFNLIIMRITILIIESMYVEKNLTYQNLFRIFIYNYLIDFSYIIILYFCKKITNKLNTTDV